MIGSALEGAPTLFSVGFDLASVGYSTHEHLVTGEATAYAHVGPRGSDGRWDVTPTGNAGFTTRFVVYRPTDSARANGTVIVEWLNVSGGIDAPAVWMPTHRHLVRDGYTWVGVSAQRVGIDGGGAMPGLGLRQTAPERYASLHHPGDAYAFDMFAQIARAVRADLADRYHLQVDRMFAVGASQSAFYLTTYANAVDMHDGAFDGFLLQGRAGAGAPIEGAPPVRFDGSDEDRAARRSLVTGSDRVREDVRVPVIVVQSETDVLGSLAYLPARQPDTDRFRLWEVAGAAHCDTYFLCAATLDSGSLPVEELAGLIGRADESGMPTDIPINSGPQMHYVLQRAFDALDQWTRGGTAPPEAARLDVDGDAVLFDDVGNARGGVRTPWVDAPTAVLSGLGQPGDLMQLFGTTGALDAATIAGRYPGGPAEHASRFRDATRAAVDAGFLLAVDAPEIEALGVIAGKRLFGA